jgi:hypothetical protein
MSVNKRWQPAAALAGGLVAFVALAGCRTFEGAAPQGDQDPIDHAGHSPAAGEISPAASPAVLPGQPAATLSPDPLDAPAPTSVLEAQRSAEMAGGDHGGHGSHGAGTYRQVDAGRGPEAHQGSEPQTSGAEGHQHHPAPPPPSGHEGHSHEPPSAEAPETEAAVYACSMHPEVTSNAPGKCSKCGMELELVERRKG